RLKAVDLPDFSVFTKEIIREGMSLSKSCFDNSKVTDHHAIIPTEQRAVPSSMNNEERRIYTMVVKRFLTCFYPRHKYRKITAEFTNPSNDKFYATGREIIEAGWKKVYSVRDDIEDDEQILPNLEQGKFYKVSSVNTRSLKTSPPSRYTEATLLSAMENPSKFISEKSMRDYIGGGLGTPATRADIIEKLYNTFYIEKKGNTIYPTSKGIQLINIVPQDLRQPLLTAQWEMRLEAIHKGTLKSDAFISDIKKYTRSLIKVIADSENSYNHDNVTNHVCPECGKFMLAVNTKKGRILVCQDRNCGWRENVVTETNLRCPECHKKMELRGDGEKKMYVCKCGYREKASIMHERLNASHVSKRDIQKYMSSQSSEKSDPSMSPFALAMQKAMKDKKE
ncbi:MAG: DNA topoisomerase III, partial [Clostridia bacterium]|nr:DNA topoisomerase III [Clostridia bacterium]